MLVEAQQLDRAQELLEDYLHRHLTSVQRTERVLIVDGLLYPIAPPVTVLPSGYETDPDGWTVWGPGVWPKWDITFEPYARPLPNWHELTYTGGYTPSSLPEALAMAICITAVDLKNREDGGAGFNGGSSIPVGAKSMSLGDASVTFGTAAGFDAGGGGSGGSTRIIPPEAQRLAARYVRRIR